nr:unnamed protein product [Spirometra erinaceieuropaei]
MKKKKKKKKRMDSPEQWSLEQVTMKPVKRSKGNLANRFQNVFKDIDWQRCYRRLVLVVVSLAIFLDNILLTSIVPIVPNILMTFKAKNVLTSVLEHSKHNCTSYASLLSTLTDAITHLTPSTSHAQAAHGTLSEIDFIDPRVASEQDRRRVTRLLQNLETLAANCNINTTAMAKEVRESRKDKEDFSVGMLFASKSIVQLVVSPMVGPLTNSSYVFLLLARAVQGAGSAFATVSVGPTYGGVVYQFVGRRVPFLILSALTGLCGILQIIVFKPAFQPEEEKGTPLCRLLMDPYILVGAGALMFGTFGMAVLEPTLPMWMKKSMKSESWEQGIIFLVSSIAYLLTANILARFVHKVGHWLSALLGMIISGVSLICVSSHCPCFGPITSGILVQTVGFGWTVRSMAIVSVSYAPLLLLLRNPQRRAENQKAEPAEDDSALKPVVASNDSKTHYSED